MLAQEERARRDRSPKPKTRRQTEQHRQKLDEDMPDTFSEQLRLYAAKAVPEPDARFGIENEPIDLTPITNAATDSYLIRRLQATSLHSKITPAVDSSAPLSTHTSAAQPGQATTPERVSTFKTYASALSGAGYQVKVKPQERKPRAGVVSDEDISMEAAGVSPGPAAPVGGQGTQRPQSAPEVASQYQPSKEATTKTASTTSPQASRFDPLGDAQVPSLKIRIKIPEKPKLLQDQVNGPLSLAQQREQSSDNDSAKLGEDSAPAVMTAQATTSGPVRKRGLRQTEDRDMREPSGSKRRKTGQGTTDRDDIIRLATPSAPPASDLPSFVSGSPMKIDSEQVLAETAPPSARSYKKRKMSNVFAHLYEWEAPELSKSGPVAYADLSICDPAGDAAALDEPVPGMCRYLRKERGGEFEEDSVLCGMRFIVG